jgi:S-adenosylmethionine:tRNA ribosyltransferase-isomerase
MKELSVGGSVELEVLFVRNLGDFQWEVLCPLRRFKSETKFSLPGGVTAEIVQRGRPQVIKVSEELGSDYFEKHGEPPLPPYIQKSRGTRHAKSEDRDWYQTVFAKKSGSSAAPTASLHFKEKDLEFLKQKGVKVVSLTLHVGLGTYLPVEAQDLNDHKRRPA